MSAISPTLAGRGANGTATAEPLPFHAPTRMAEEGRPEYQRLRPPLQKRERARLEDLAADSEVVVADRVQEPDVTEPRTRASDPKRAFVGVVPRYGRNAPRMDVGLVLVFTLIVPAIRFRRHGGEHVVGREGAADTLERKFARRLDGHGVFNRHQHSGTN
jgi:hypothetical protein